MTSFVSVNMCARKTTVAFDKLSTNDNIGSETCVLRKITVIFMKDKQRIWMCMPRKTTAIF